MITFGIGLALSLGLESVIKTVRNLWLSFLALAVVIMLGIIADAVGTAATAAEMAPFNAMAARKVFGAKQAVRLVRNADLVANLTADVGGDIAGTLSGAIGAAIIFELAHVFSALDTVIWGAVMTSLIAATTVSGKMIGKNYAIRHANPIVFRVAKALTWWERLTGLEVLGGRR